jgi:hypothetical protein
MLFLCQTDEVTVLGGPHRAGLLGVGGVVVGALTVVIGSPNLLDARTDDDVAVGDAPTIALCHSVGEFSWSLLVLAASGDVSGHAHHSGDILPAFAYEDQDGSVVFAGQNLGPLLPDGTTGQEILDAGCVTPPGPPPTTVTPTTVTPTTVTPTTVTPTTVTPTTVTPTTVTPTTVTPPVETTIPARPPIAACDDDELAWKGRCFQVPDYVFPIGPTAPIAPDVSVPTLPPLERPDVDTLTPTVDCVDSDGSTNVVWFGYQLDADRPAVVPRGPDNTVTPAGIPPVLFGPGRHVYVFSIMTDATTASWELDGTVAVADASSPRCGEAIEPPVPSTTDVATTTTEPEEVPEQPTCPPGQRDSADGCVDVEPVELVLVDNVIECSGEAIAVFAAFNPNGFTITPADSSSRLTPPALDGQRPDIIFVAANEGAVDDTLIGLFAVRYIRALSWTVEHDGLTSSVSAGALAGRQLGDCDDPASAIAGISGAGGDVPVTGTNLHVGAWALLLVLTGAAMTAVARRPAARSNGDR